jgi:arylsulfatase A-like enzyme
MLALRDSFIDWWTHTPAPRFAIVEFGAAHEPFKYPPAELLPAGYPPCGLTNCTNRKEYEAEIVGMDTAIGQMRAAMGPAAYSIFFGDNGTPGVVNGEPPAQTVATRPGQDPLRVKLSTYEDGVRVPLIISGPGIVPSESQVLAHAIDLFPTITRMAGIAPDPDPLIHGRSFAATLIGLPGQRSHVFVWNPLRNDTALIERELKLLVDEQGVEHFYDLAADPEELVELPRFGPDYNRLVARRTSILAGNP